MEVSLIINGKTADISSGELILMTYQASDAEQPAAVKNSYSQSVTLPSTPANDAIFSHLLRSDFKRTTGRFDVLARTPFEIRNEMQEILVSGYLKLNGGVPGTSYDVSLFGGLGGFFYSLKYNSDGTEMTLADLAWPWGSGFLAADNSGWKANANLYLSAAGLASRYNGTLDTASPVAFAPFDEGIPQDFGADKGLFMVGGGFNEILTTKTVDTDTYYPKSGVSGGILVEFSEEHDAWEMQEFRNTQQRPLWNVGKFLAACAYSGNNGGYTVEIDPVFTASALYTKAWVTLKRDFADDLAADGSLSSLEPLLRDTKTPCDYLLSIAKLCGLMFIYDEQAKKVQILTRNTYYEKYCASFVSLDGLIAEDKGKTITPLLMSDKWQVLSAENYGGNAEDYEERKGRQYGSLWVNTGYEFGGNENDVLESSVFKGAADALRTNINYRIVPRSSGSQGLAPESYLKFGATDAEISYKLYTVADSTGSQKSLDCSLQYSAPTYAPPALYKYYNTGHDYGLPVTLPQLCDSDRGGESGEDVMLFYAGRQSFPSGEYSSGLEWEVYFYATEDTQEMLDLNGGKPCWRLQQGTQTARVTQFPVFQRQLAGSDDWSMLFSKPSEFYTPDTAYVSAVKSGDYIGARFWQSWLEERCHADVRRMKCWVNLRTSATPKIDADLLRRFWYYEGAIWVLDKISSHSLTTDDLTECEFIKVRDIRNYSGGQNWNDAYLKDSRGYYMQTMYQENIRVKGQ